MAFKQNSMHKVHVHSPAVHGLLMPEAQLRRLGAKNFLAHLQFRRQASCQRRTSIRTRAEHDFHRPPSPALVKRQSTGMFNPHPCLFLDLQ